MADIHIQDTFTGADDTEVDDRALPVQEGTSGVTWTATATYVTLLDNRMTLRGGVF
jgi:hypothetical protein